MTSATPVQVIEHLSPVSAVFAATVPVNEYVASDPSSAVEDIDHEALWLPPVNVVCRSGAHTPNCSVTDRDEYIERKLLSTRSTQHVHVREEEWEVGDRGVADGKEMNTECAVVLRQSVQNRNVLYGFLSLRDIAKRFCCEQRKTLSRFQFVTLLGSKKT